MTSQCETIAAKIPAKIIFSVEPSKAYSTQQRKTTLLEWGALRQKSCRLPFYCSDLEHILLYYIISVTICCGAQRTKALSQSRKFWSPKMNLNTFLCRFPTVFGKYIRILDQVSKIRRFHSIPFEFQGFENRPQICFLPFRILYCKPILRALSLLVCGL